MPVSCIGSSFLCSEHAHLAWELLEIFGHQTYLVKSENSFFWLFLLWFEGDKVFMLLTISSAVLRVNTVSSSGGRDFLRRERRAWVQPLVRALRSHKLHGIARGKNEEAFLIVLTGKCAGTAYSHKTRNLCFARHICKEAGYSVYSIQHLVKYKSCVLIIMQPLASCIIITNLENDIEPLRQVDEMARGKALECGWKEAHQNSPEELSNTHHDENLLLIASLTPTLLYPSPEGSPLINLDGSDTYQLGGALTGHYWDLLLIVLWIFVTVSSPECSPDSPVTDSCTTLKKTMI
ncbi:hypothetical protein MJT46_015587 [Ovis ammon polii x Ovis aries]|nr:hypothetical protein MJT46_015587 [Ovis ammon polii x Ovis aries]